ncbi:MAG TPA: nuclear transport factor 2 family protein [Chryseolinea sp.]|nr:nuclear transport factor 2 family protein [Chryseolinea sp.]HPH46668.1 nuclear transport factor 2 family protein [Chryseolinea sp.]HPM31696.1 nuclear transport factor 2 family protein [Chryseolinea sp.]
MKQFILSSILILLSAESFSQDYKKEINDQVWKPFIQTFNNFDAVGFLSVHSKDVVRSSRDSKEILNWDEYLKQQKAGDQQSMKSGSKRTLELRFTERIANNNQAIEVGIYKTTSINSKGEIRSFYGRFHVVLRKENNTWKILVDTDSSEGNTISENEYLSAHPLE